MMCVSLLKQKFQEKTGAQRAQLLLQDEDGQGSENVAKLCHQKKVQPPGSTASTLGTCQEIPPVPAAGLAASNWAGKPFFELLNHSSCFCKAVVASLCRTNVPACVCDGRVSSFWRKMEV